MSPIDPAGASSGRHALLPPPGLQPGDGALREFFETLPDRAKQLLLDRWGTEALDIDRAAVEATLAEHGFGESFHARALEQLREHGEITIGLIDTADGLTRHGDSVIARLEAAMPDYLVDHVRVRVFDYNEPSSDAAFRNALEAGRNGELLALSVSGGTRTLPIDGLRALLGGPVEPGDLARPGVFERAVELAGADPESARLRHALGELARDLPVVTPIWNRDASGTELTTLTAVSSANVIVTSAGEGERDVPGGIATRSPLVDARIPPIGGALPFTAGHTASSPSVPIFLGEALHGLDRAEVDEALAAHRDR